LSDEQIGRPSSWNEEDEESLTWEQVHRYLEAPLRRPWLLVGPWVAIILLSVAALWFLPKKYLSSTLIMVESEKVPDSFVRSVATRDSGGGRLETVREEMLSRTRLEKVLADTQPYPDTESLTRAVQKLREATTIRVGGQDGFTVEFMHHDPYKAQEVTERLTTLFIEESISARARQVEEAIEFLEAQVTEARRELDKKDAAVRRYKEAQMGRLPEQLDSNLATLEMLQRQLEAVEESLNFNRSRQETLARNIETGAPAPGSPSQFESELADLERELGELQGRYTDEHPQVRSLKSRIASLQARWASATDDAEKAPLPPPAANPPVAVTELQLRQATGEISKLESKRTELERRIATMRARVEDTPRTVQELESLNRDYKKLSENYQALLTKQLDAQMAGRLERRWKGERFRVLDPAYLPEKPYSPRPLKLLVIGALAGFLVGMGACLLAEFLDSTIKDAEDLSALGGYPVLASIPDLRTRSRYSTWARSG
jgi:polysaccharide chain length determinant protein (PEP-CTERM system associated)